MKWYPQIAIRADQAAGAGAWGAIPVFSGTLLISFVAMMVAGPIGLMSAIYFSEYPPRMRGWAKPILENWPNSDRLWILQSHLLLL